MLRRKIDSFLGSERLNLASSDHLLKKLHSFILLFFEFHFLHMVTESFVLVATGNIVIKQLPDAISIILIVISECDVAQFEAVNSKGIRNLLIRLKKRRTAVLLEKPF